MGPVSNGFFPIPSTAQTVVTVVYLGLEGSMEVAQGTKLPDRPFNGRFVFFLCLRPLLSEPSWTLPHLFQLLVLLFLV